MVIQQNEELSVTRLITLGKNQSITSLVLSPCSSLLAAGTNDGEIVLLDRFDQSLSDTPRSIRRAYHRPGILNLIFISLNRLLSISSDGHCRIWDLECMEFVYEFEIDSLPNSLCSAWNNQLILFFQDGQLAVWDTIDGKLDNRKSIQNTEIYKSITSICYWPIHKVLVTPTNQGNLSLWDKNFQQTGMINGQNGPLLCTGFLDHLLVTYGKNDGSVRLWDREKPVASLDTREEIQSSAGFGIEKNLLACVTKTGQAKLLQYDGGNLYTTENLSDNRYTIAAGPTSEFIQQERRKKKIHMADRLQQKARTFIMNHDWIASERSIQELESEGFSNTALALRVEQAEQHEDSLEALRLLWALYQRLPQSDTRTSIWLEKLLFYLNRYCLNDASRTILKHLSEINSQHNNEENRRKNTTDQQEQRVLVECSQTDISFNEILSAARIVGVLPRHLHIIETFSAVLYPGEPITLNGISTLYSKQTQFETSLVFPSLILQSVLWKDHHSTQKIDVLTTEIHEDHCDTCVGLCIRLDKKGLRQFIQPFLYFDFERYQKNGFLLTEETESRMNDSIQSERQHALSTLKILENSIRKHLTKNFSKHCQEMIR
jgi:hypothetical protein